MSDDMLIKKINDLSARVQTLERVERPAPSIQGVWTPTYYGLTTAGSATYAVQKGTYLRIGNLCIATAWLNWSAHTGTGGVAISLPLAAVNVASQRYSAALWTYNLAFSTTPPQALVQPGDNFLTLWSPANNAASPQLSVDAAGEIVFTLSYFIA